MMRKFKIQDRVSVLDEDLSGTIVKIIGNAVTVEDEFGFEHVYQSEHLVLKEELDYSMEIAVDKSLQNTAKSIPSKDQRNFFLDLHIQKLVHTSSQLGSADRIEIQRLKLLETLEFCKNNRVKKLEIIHGIGDGVLQNMVHEILQNKGLEFYDNAVLQEQSGSVAVFF